MLGAVDAPPGEETAEGTERFAEFFEAEHRRLFGTLRLVTRDRGEAEELMQEAFLKVWERWDRVREADSPSGYLYQTAFNLFRSRYRKALRAARRIIFPPPQPDELAAIEDRHVLLGALRRLPARQSAAIVLTELMDLPSEEAARALRVRPVTVRVLASQGRERLRQMLGADDV
jgi:RNA polymerase sigma factor (sigma-70 family)